MIDLLEACGLNPAMFRFLAQRKIARTVAEEKAADLLMTVGGPTAMATVRRDLRWLDPSDSDRERELTFMLRAIEKQMHYHPPADTSQPRFLDTFI